MTASRPSPTLAQRLGLIAWGVLLPLLLVEGTLQVLRAANLVRTESERRDLAGRKVAYAIGDSHTWGWGVHPLTEAMPVRLEARLNRDDPAGPFVVENLGFPGFNVAQAGARLRQACAQHRPDLVLVLAGFNDAWNSRQPQRESHFLVLPRLLALWRLNREDAGTADPTELVLIDGEPHHRQPDGSLVPVRGEQAREDLHGADEQRRVVEAGLREITDFCRRQGIPVVLQTYASTANARFLAASEAARAVALGEELPLVDHARCFEDRGLRPEGHLQPDGHPTAAGCDAMAEDLYEALRALPGLREWSEPGAAAAAGTEEGPAFVRLAPPRRTADGWTLELEGTPGAPWQLSLSLARHDPALGPHPLHPQLGLQVDALCLESRSFAVGVRGRFDAGGTARAEVLGALLDRFGPGPYLAQAVVLRAYSTGDPGRDLRAFSEVVELSR